MTNQVRSRITEDLTTLYLRLNGYFTTGFMLHSPEWTKLHAEIDCLAVRFPHSSETERGIGPDPALETSSSHIDLLVCEVKCKGEALQFNKPIRKDADRFARVLRWSGLFSPEQVGDLAKRLLDALTPKPIAEWSIPLVPVDERIQIRGVVSSPERLIANRRRTDPWYLGGDQIMDYAWRCLCPEAPRPTSSTSYDYTRWGYLEPIVRYFKARKSNGPGKINDLYSYLSRCQPESQPSQPKP